GRSDPNEQLMALYHDPRPTSRVFHMTFGNGEWTLLREDSDFHQVSSPPSRTTGSTDGGTPPKMPALPGARTSI
ncbi:MAG: hypothetical protein M3O70_18200, partial [Actinomycetota bacterium]|nr:hypothetical protein [Actinomycetota bacterium]